jgi:quinoprotein relay system zinc metallohydrolase 2
VIPGLPFASPRWLLPRLLSWLLLGLLSALLPGPLAWVACAFAQAAIGTAPLAVTQVKPGVFVHIGALDDWAPANGGDVANIGFVLGSRCVAVIDTGGTPNVGQRLRAAVERTTPIPVCYVINTHAHPDHVLGNGAFAGASRPAPQFVASSRFTHALATREAYYLNALQRDFGIQLTNVAIVYPAITVDRSLDLDLGDRVLTLQAWPTAHTDNDLTVYDRRTRTLFASDLLFAQHLPALDGSLRGWVSVMAEFKRLDVTTVVPGHGPVSDDWPAAMDAQADYLNALLRDTRAAIRNRLTIQQAIDSIGVPPASHWLLTDRFHRRNVTAAYAELEWEDDDPKTLAAPSPAARPALPRAVR